MMVNWNIGAPPILSFLNKLMKSWKNRAGPGVDSGKIMMVGMILRMMIARADTTLFKQMNILFKWILWILKNRLYFCIEYHCYDPEDDDGDDFDDRMQS